MAIIECSECGKKYSNKAKACPECACPTGETFSHREVFPKVKEPIKSTPGHLRSHLSSGEQVLCVAKVHWQFFSRTAAWSSIWLFAALICLSLNATSSNGISFGGIGLATIFLIPFALMWTIRILQYRSLNFVVTNKRVLIKFGVLERDSAEIRLDKVEEVSTEQSLSGRILGYASIFIKGTGKSVMPILFISNYVEFKRTLMDACDNLKNN